MRNMARNTDTAQPHTTARDRPMEDFVNHRRGHIFDGFFLLLRETLEPAGKGLFNLNAADVIETPAQRRDCRNLLQRLEIRFVVGVRRGSFQAFLQG